MIFLSTHTLCSHNQCCYLTINWPRIMQVFQTFFRRKHVGKIIYIYDFRKIYLLYTIKYEFLAKDTLFEVVSEKFSFIHFPCYTIYIHRNYKLHITLDINCGVPVYSKHINQLYVCRKMKNIFFCIHYAVHKQRPFISWHKVLLRNGKKVFNVVFVPCAP